MKSKSFLVTVYYRGESEPMFNALQESDFDWVLSSNIEHLAQQTDPDSKVFDVAIDFKLKRIVQVLLRNWKNFSKK